MTDTSPYYSLIKRQNDKLRYAPVVEAAFRQAVIELGPNPSLNELSRWLSGRVRPSAKAKKGAKWTAQTVKDWLYFDGVEPTYQNLDEFLDKSRSMNQSRLEKWKRELGFRFTAFEIWERVKEPIKGLEGEERAEFQYQKLQAHFDEIARVAQGLRATLRIPVKVAVSDL